MLHRPKRLSLISTARMKSSKSLNLVVCICGEVKTGESNPEPTEPQVNERLFPFKLFLTDLCVGNPHTDAQEAGMKILAAGDV